MRDRIIVVVCALGLISVIGGIVLFVNSGGTVVESQPKEKERERVQVGQGIFVGGPFFNVLFDEQAPDASQSVGGGTQASSPVVRTTSSPAGGGAPPAARPAAPAVQTAVPACSPSLLASVVGLLGGVLGGGGVSC